MLATISNTPPANVYVHCSPRLATSPIPTLIKASFLSINHRSTTHQNPFSPLFCVRDRFILKVFFA